MPIENGQLTSADEVKQQQGIALTNLAQIIYNADYIGFDSQLFGNSGVPNFNKLVYSVSDASADFATTLGTHDQVVNNLNVFFDSSSRMLYAGQVYDYMEGTTPSGTNWVDVGTDALTITQTDNQYVEGDDTTANNTSFDSTLSAALLNVKPASGDEGEFIVRVRLESNRTGSGDATKNLFFYMRDESGNQVTLDSVSEGGAADGSTTLDKVYRVVLSTNNAEVRDITSSYPGSLVGNVDTSSLVGSSWHLRGRSQLVYNSGVVNTESAKVKFYPIVFVRNSSDTGTKYDVETAITTASSTVDSAYLTMNGESTSNFTASVSADSGANYDSINNNDFAVISNTGTGFQTKINMGEHIHHYLNYLNMLHSMMYGRGNKIKWIY